MRSGTSASPVPGAARPAIAISPGMASRHNASRAESYIVRSRRYSGGNRIRAIDIILSGPVNKGRYVSAFMAAGGRTRVTWPRSRDVMTMISAYPLSRR